MWIFLTLFSKIHNIITVIKILRHASLRMAFIYPCSKLLFLNIKGHALIKKMYEKSEFSNLLFDPICIIEMICMNFIRLDSPENQLFNSIYYVYEPLGGRYQSSIHCDLPKMGLIDCCLSLKSKWKNNPFSLFFPTFFERVHTTK